MKVDIHTMEGLLRGKCLPANILVNESLAEYLVRQFNAIHERAEAAERERDEYAEGERLTAVKNVELQDEIYGLKAELARRDAAAGEAVGLVELSDYMTAEELTGMKPRRVAVKELFEGALKVGDHIYTAAQPAELPDAEREMWRNNLKDAGHALSDIRRFVEEKFKCVADLPSTEAVLIAGPEVKHESDAIIAALNRVAEFYEMGALPQKPVFLPAERFCAAEYAGSLLWAETEVWNKAMYECAASLDAAGIPYEVKP